MEEYTTMISNSTKISNVPELITILPLGNVSSEKGDFFVDRESFEMIKQRMQKRKIDIVVDYEHQTLENVQAPASGWIKDIRLQNNCIVAKVDWTDKAKSYLRNKEYRYLSPVVLVRKKDCKAMEIHSVALTNTPAINGMIPIVNSIKPIHQNEIVPPCIDDSTKQILHMLNVSMDDFQKYGK